MLGKAGDLVGLGGSRSEPDRRSGTSSKWFNPDAEDGGLGLAGSFLVGCAE